MKLKALMLFTGVTLLSVGSVNAEEKASIAQLIDELRVCEGVSNALERLVCFDELVKALPTSESVTATPISKRTVAENEESEAFLNIVEMWQNRRGMWLIRLANGEVWRQTEIASAFPFSEDRDYYFQTGMFEAHYLRTPGLNRRVRMVRDN